VFGDLLPNNLATWVILLGACLLGIMIGKLIRDRRDRTAAGGEAFTRTASTQPRKRLSKKARLKARRTVK